MECGREADETKEQKAEGGGENDGNEKKNEMEGGQEVEGNNEERNEIPFVIIESMLQLEVVLLFGLCP